MVILSTDIAYRLSGGAANSNVNLSLGGAKSSVALVDNTVNNLFADSLGPESLAGSIKYRAIYVHNAHASLTMQNSKVYITTNTPSTDTVFDVAVGTAAINATEQTVANEDTAPTGVTWGQNSTYATGYALGDIPFGQHKAIWFRRTVTAGASAFNNDTVVFEVGCDSAA
jgi:hypothetical protein